MTKNQTIVYKASSKEQSIQKQTYDKYVTEGEISYYKDNNLIGTLSFVAFDKTAINRDNIKLNKIISYRFKNLKDMAHCVENEHLQYLEAPANFTSRISEKTTSHIVFITKFKLSMNYRSAYTATYKHFEYIESSTIEYIIKKLAFVLEKSFNIKPYAVVTTIPENNATLQEYISQVRMLEKANFINTDKKNIMILLSFLFIPFNTYYSSCDIHDYFPEKNKEKKEYAKTDS